MSAAGQFPWEIALILGVGAAIVIWFQRLRARALIDTAAEARADELEAATLRSAQLQRELAEAKTTIRTQNDLLAQLSREVRGHMDGIIGSANLLLDTKLPSGQRQQLITLRATGESLLYVLGDVQAIVQAEINAVRNEHAVFELRQEIAHVFDVLAPRAALKGVEVSLIIAPEVPRRLVGDVPLMRQFFFNLLASALRLTPSGSIILRVERTVGPSDTKAPSLAWLRFAVTDVTHLQATLAVASGSQNPFPTATRSALETGDNLALTVARRQVGIMGGKFGEATTTERGPEIWFDLPLEAGGALASPAMDTAATDSFIVVFDDLPSARVAASNLLDEMGVEHDVAKSSAEAIEALGDAVQAHPGPLLLLLDESISIQDLGTLVSAFRDQPDLRNVKVVLMSLRPDKVAVEMGLPVRAVLQKPLLLPREVLEAIETARATSGAGRSPEPTLSQPPFPLVERASLPHVLLVEDNEVSRQVCETMLKRMGCRVDLAADGVEAVEQAKRREYDIIFMDCWMPRLDGYSASRQIHDLLGAKVPPIIALTADDLQENRVKAEKSGMVDFMVKPASRAEFTRVFGRWLKGKTLVGSQPPV